MERRPAEPAAAVEPVSPDPPGLPGRALLTQSWLDLAFLHWPADPEVVEPLLPSGTRADVLNGVTYVGLIAFRMHRIGWIGLPGLPYFGSFAETNVRLYSVDRYGRRGVVFRSLEASRLLPVLVARSTFRLPYQWAKMEVRRIADGREATGSGTRGGARTVGGAGAGTGDVLDYTSRRRWSAPRGAYARISIRVGEPIAEPSPLEHFVTARWGLHNDWFGRPIFLPNVHPRWTLHRASLLRCDEDLIAAAGLPAPAGPPTSVLYSPGVPVRFGGPLRPGPRR